MKTSYTKKCTLPHDLIPLLKSRGLIISNEQKVENYLTNKRIYFRICIIKYLLFTVSPNNRFTEKLKSLLAEYPTVDILAMGFPVDWESEPLWI